MSSWDAAVVIGSSYSPSDPLTLFGFLSRKATACCLCPGGVPGSVHLVANLQGSPVSKLVVVRPVEGAAADRIFCIYLDPVPLF
jgi:hypothetical protein